MTEREAAVAGRDGGFRIRGAPLEVRRLVKAFGATRVVDDVSFKIDSGMFLTLLGPSGSGKTTTLRMIAGFEEPTGGEIRVGGKVVTDTPAHKRNIGVVFQQYALFPHLTVFKNVAYPLEMRRRSRIETQARVVVLLPHELAGCPNLDSINFEAVDFPAVFSTRSTIAEEKQSLLVWPFHGNPHPDSAAVTAEGPGTAKSGIPAWRQATIRS